MKTKSIESVIQPPEIHWVGNGFRVHNFIPGAELLAMERMNPFVMLDYNSKHYFPPSEKPRGVGVHPHRGFETVTISYKGRIAHHDSNGGGGVIGEGDVQWMTAASGVLHKEYHEEEWSKQGGDFHVVQLWVNLPAKYKMSKPRYQAISKSIMGKVQLPGNTGIVEVISGSYMGTDGPASSFTPVNLFNAHISRNGKADFSFPANYNTALLVIEGTITVNEKETVAADNFILFRNDGENFTISAVDNSIVLIMSGEPINEPIAAYGPFVMNTRQEIIQAIDDFNQGKFGSLED
ncbi:MAG TPA: pirin family protein [Bacteroidales bacterium]|nr:pirin family protein [Bacteroidales bacterium]